MSCDYNLSNGANCFLYCVSVNNLLLHNTHEDLGFHIKKVTLSCQKNEFPSRRTSEIVVVRSQNILKITKKLYVMFAKQMIQYDQLPAVAIKFMQF